MADVVSVWENLKKVSVIEQKATLGGSSHGWFAWKEIDMMFWSHSAIVHPPWKWWKGDACGAAGYAVLKESTNLSALQYEIAIYRLM